VKTFKKTRGIHTGQSNRTTNDLDVVVEVGVELEIENDVIGSLIHKASIVLERACIVCTENLPVITENRVVKKGGLG
jgi:hypothetical protein